MLAVLRTQLDEHANGDSDLLFALRRKIYKELTYDERGKPMHRRALKLKKIKEQGGLCFLCQEQLPASYTVLDRLEAMPGYTAANTRVLCRDCDTRTQIERRYS
ncbi:hypothetical protein [Terriglobus sp.]|uniref:hypothetical protein n=1 Tax=Terriglobus sp. TaxID=1889013 RepID=UPI003B00BD7D